MTFRTNQPGSALATQVSLHFWSRACKIEQWILEEFNFEGHDSFFFFFALAFELSSFLFQSTHSTQIAPVAPASASIRRAPTYSPLPRLPNNLFFRIRRARKKKNGDPSPKKPRAAAAPTSTATAWRSSSLIRTTTNQNIIQIDI